MAMQGMTYVEIRGGGAGGPLLGHTMQVEWRPQAESLDLQEVHIKVKGVWSRDLNARVVTIAQAATGRHGDYDGRIGVDATGGD